MRLTVLAVMIASLSICVSAQLVDQDDIQSWNDFQITVPLGKKVDYYNRLTGRFGGNVSQLNDDRLQVGIVWKPVKDLSISPFYWYIHARNAVNNFRIENRFNLSGTYRLPIKKFGLSHRSTYEKRLRRVGNSWRYRGMVTIEKDLPKDFISGAKVFIADEVFYDSLLRQFSRNRFAVGISKLLSKQLTLDVSYMRQNDGFSRPGDLHTIWTSWKLKL